MASAPGYTPDPVSDMAGSRAARSALEALELALQHQPDQFELFQALRLLERATPDHPRLGRSLRAAEDRIRLRHPPSLTFAPTDIVRYTPGRDGVPARMDSAVMGLFGPNGALPLHLTEYALERAGVHDRALQAFADIFHHRMISLFYRAWADAQPTVQADRPGEDAFRDFLGALAGMMRPPANAAAAGIGRYHAGRLLPASRNAEGLRALVMQTFGLPVEIIDFVPEWMLLPDDARCHLGRQRSAATLGTDAVLGRHVRGVQSRIRLRLGPLDRDAFRRFLPGGDALQALTALIQLYLGDLHAWGVQLVLRASQVPPTRLGHSSRLGLDSWIGQIPAIRGDADDVVFHPTTRHAITARGLTS